MTQKVYIKSKRKNIYLITWILHAFVLVVLLVLYYSWIGNDLKFDSSDGFFFSLISISTLLQGISYYLKYIHAKQPIIEYSPDYFQVNKWNLLSKKQGFQKDEIKAKKISKGDIEIETKPRPYRLRKSEMSKQDYNKILSYLNLN